MSDVGRTFGVGALVLGGLALFVPSILSRITGVTRSGGYAGYGGMMGGYGGMMGGYGGMMGGYGGMMGGYGGMMGGYGGLGAGWGVLGLVSQLGFYLLLAGGAYLLYRTFVAEGGSDLGGSDDAVEELRRRYARGELSDEEFEARRTRLERDGPQ